MLLYFSHYDSDTKADFLVAARWIRKARKAAIQGVMKAQYELGEMFRHSLFCDTSYMRLARKYVRRATFRAGPRRGHRAHAAAAQLHDVRCVRGPARVLTMPPGQVLRLCVLEEALV